MNGAKLDKLWIASIGTAPEDEGSAGSNCATSAGKYELATNIAMYQNPVHDELTITLPVLPVTISIYNSYGNNLFHQKAYTASKTICMANYKQGIYLVKIAGQHQTIVKKIIKK